MMLLSHNHAHFNPATAGATVALDARFLTGLADGADVTSWAGRPGTSKTASEAGSGTRPVYKTASGASRSAPVVRFAGSGRVLSCSSVASSQPYTIFLVSAIRSVQGRTLSGNPNNWLLGSWTTYSNRFYNGSAWVYQGTDTSTDMIIHVARAASNAADYYQSGSANALAVSSTGAPDGLDIGGGWVGSEYSDADVSCVLAWTSALTDALRRRIEQSLAFSFRIACA